MKTKLVLLFLAACLGCSENNSNVAANPETPPGKTGEPGGNPTPPVQPNPTPAPTPEPDPSQVEAIVATSWKNVKFAFCSAQGSYGVLIDFQGTDLSVSKSGSFKMGTRSCRGNKPFQWGKVMTFTSTVNGKEITFNFGNTLSPPNCYGCGDDTIEFYGDLGPYETGHGVMGGNSGPCVFLENKATGGDVFASSPLFRCK